MLLSPSRSNIARVLILAIVFNQIPQRAWAAKRSSVATQSASSSSTESSDASPADTDEGTDLAPGFLIRLNSPQDSKLNGDFRIQINGNIELPYSTQIDTKGMTLGQFRRQLIKSYASYFKGQANISASVKQKRYWIEVLGLVVKPGQYLVRQNSPLDEIISSAGGVGEDMAAGFIRIVQGGKTSWIDLTDYYKGRETEVPLWQGADRIFFQRERPEFAADPLDAETARKVQVIGEVRAPGELTFHREADAYYYLIKSGGPSTSADLDKVEVIRPDKSTGKRQPISMGSIADIGSVQGGDILMFHPQRASTFDRGLTITATIASILTTVLLGYIAVKRTN